MTALTHPNARRFARHFGRGRRTPGVEVPPHGSAEASAAELDLASRAAARLAGSTGPAPNAPARGRRSPLARRIVGVNLVALMVLATGVLSLNPFRASLVVERERALVSAAEILARVAGDDAAEFGVIATGLDLARGAQLLLFDAEGVRLAAATGGTAPKPAPATVLASAIDGIRGTATHRVAASARPVAEDMARRLLPRALRGTVAVDTADAAGATVFAVAAPVLRGGHAIGAVAIVSAAGEIDDLVRVERERVLKMFVVASLISIGVSLALASTIAAPLSALAAAAEQGRRHQDPRARRLRPGRIRLPDLSARRDEIGRLAGAMDGMVAALYERIDANEQFAADVTHEVKNPLASLRSAVMTLRSARTDQRAPLMDVIEHDVRRLDRLVSEIAAASRLDRELVRDEEAPFDLVRTLDALATHFAQESAASGIEVTADLPRVPVVVRGLEARLAQVVGNLIGNAVSFSEAGDAVRVWLRRSDRTVLIVVEDTGPGIPEAALGRIFERFYSERPQGDFGNHSGLGLAISRQIVEAHGGVIWAENIRPAGADATAEPTGARFVVCLPQ